MLRAVLLVLACIALCTCAPCSEKYVSSVNQTMAGTGKLLVGIEPPGGVATLERTIAASQEITFSCDGTVEGVRVQFADRGRGGTGAIVAELFTDVPPTDLAQGANSVSSTEAPYGGGPLELTFPTPVSVASGESIHIRFQSTSNPAVEIDGKLVSSPQNPDNSLCFWCTGCFNVPVAAVCGVIFQELFVEAIMEGSFAPTPTPAPMVSPPSAINVASGFKSLGGRNVVLDRLIAFILSFDSEIELLPEHLTVSNGILKRILSISRGERAVGQAFEVTVDALCDGPVVLCVDVGLAEPSCASANYINCLQQQFDALCNRA